MDVTEEIVISGIAGRFPQCNNIEELLEALLNGVDLVTEDRRFPPGVMGIPKRISTIPELDKFDATFFGVHAKQAEYMDPRHRILLETVYECIVDAGYNPQELRGSQTGVYVGMSAFTNLDGMREHGKSDGYVNTGVCLGMSANRISYCFDFKGKSYTLDTACSSASIAFVNAVEDIRLGNVDAAVVCGGQVMFHPHENVEFNNLNMLSVDGKCKVFNKLRDGYVRGESIVSLFLQKKNDSRRVYASVLGAKSNADGYKAEGITFPSTYMQERLMKDIYVKQNINIDEVSYIEAHGTGTPAGDIQELQAIVNTFCVNRKTPLPVGAIKSNMGHSEAASGLCSVSKVLIAMETGIIPANLHVDPLDTDLPGIKDGKLKVVTENLHWNRGLVALNCFGFGGANAHIVLRPNPKEKCRNYKPPKHRLVHVSGRTEEAVNHFLDQVEKNQHDEEFLTLVDEIHRINCEGHNFRGYTILGDQPKRQVDRYIKPRPIWFIYTGMGSQWLGMGRDLMRNHIFRNTIKRCAAALKPFDIDLEHILTSDAPDIFDTSSNCFAGIIAVEIAMTDVLFSMGITPDGFAGHSLGEVGCAYADGQITPEQAVLLGYARGYGTQRATLEPGSMAAVGLGREECLKILPEDVFIACQNGKGSTTITGPGASVAALVEKLTNQGVFARKVDSGGLAYHSRYIEDAAPYLYDFAKNILKDPKPRSSKWLSTSVPENQRNEYWARYNTAEYHRNNFCNTVLFDRVYEHIPENAIVVEVASHGLLQAILKRELGPNVTILSLANRNSPDNEEFFLSSIGKIYLAGGQPNLKNLYPGVEYPVSRGTKMLSPMVKWDHKVSWFTSVWNHKDYYGQVMNVNISNEDYAYLSGHNIDGRVLMPATGYLELAWKTLSKLNMKDIEEVPIVIENMKFQRATVLPPNTDVQFLVNLMKQSGYFEIYEGGAVVCSGTISTSTDVGHAYSKAQFSETTLEGYLPLTSEDIYKECHLRRYMYEGLFQGIKECDVQGIKGRVKWHGNFCSFLDTMMHVTVISQTNRDLFLPTGIKKLVVDPRKHLTDVQKNEDLPIFFNEYVNVISSGGAQIIGLSTSKIPKRKQVQDPLLETYEYLIYDTPKNDETNLDVCLSTVVQILLQNRTGMFKAITLCEFSKEDTPEVTDKVKKILDSQPMIEVNSVTFDAHDSKSTFDFVILTENLLQKVNEDTIFELLNEGGMIMYRGDVTMLTKEKIHIIYKSNDIYLVRPNNEILSDCSVIHVNNSDLSWLESVKQLVKFQNKQRVFLVSQNEDTSGIVGLTKCLLTEPTSCMFRCVFIQDEKAPVFSLNHDFYREQLKKDLTFNVLRSGKWGTFVHLPLKPIENRNVEDATVSVLTVGDLSTLNWVEKSSNYIKPDQKSEKVYVYYSSLNFKDVMVATGKLQLSQPDEPTIPEINIGLEYAGITENGKRVMGLVGYEGLSLQIQTDPGFTWDVPKEWGLDEAATVPSVYATCYYALIVRGRMQPGESILIHAGTGGIGMAAISIALSMGCTVFTTVSSKEKRDFLKKCYPQIKDENIGHSRSSSFVTTVMENTKGKGVDLVLNSLAGELFKGSLECIASKGRFLEIGKVELVNNTLIETKMFLKNCSFHGIFLDELFDSRSKVKMELKQLLSDGIKHGVVKPLPRTVFKEDQVEEAFRFLASGKHKGKVVIELRKETASSIRDPIRSISAVPKLYFDPNKSYILVGGLGGIGLEFADWLMRRGATKIVLNSRRPISNGYQSYCLKKWFKWSNVRVNINTSDTTTLNGAKELVSCANRLGPVGGVFNLALVLRDSLIENQTKESFEAVFQAKIWSGSNMDQVTRQECPELEHFVVFSSATCGRGNSGQSNYGMANSALEQLCEKRRKDNLPALAVQWGPIGEVGALIKMKVINKIIDEMEEQTISSCFESLEKFMLQKRVVGSSIVVGDKDATGNQIATKSPAEAVAHILGIRNLDLVDETLTLAQLGLDSLMVAEIKQTLYRNYQLEVDPEQLKDLTFSHLKSLAKDKQESSSSLKDENNNNDYQVVSALLSKESIIVLNQGSTESKTIFFIPPIQGHVEVLKHLAASLKAVVYGLQCTQDTNFDSIQEFAKHFVKLMKTKQKEGPYFVCGYSFGAAVALEMGLQLEKDGEVVSLVLLDGSPNYVKKTLEYLFEKNDKSVSFSKNMILVKFVTPFTSLDQNKISERLATTEDFDKKLQILGDIACEETNLHDQLVRTSAELYYKRCVAGFTYVPQGVFRGKITLIRAFTSLTNISEDYELHKQCQQKADVVKLKGDHNTMLTGDNGKIISEKINVIL